MSDNTITYLVNVPPDRVEALAQAMAQAELEFDPRSDMVMIRPLPEDAVYLTGLAADDLAHDINEFLNENGWGPGLRIDTGDWPVERLHQLLEFAADNLTWEGNSISDVPHHDSATKWRELAATAPDLFEQE